MKIKREDEDEHEQEQKTGNARNGKINEVKGEGDAEKPPSSQSRRSTRLSRKVVNGADDAKTTVLNERDTPVHEQRVPRKRRKIKKEEEDEQDIQQIEWQQQPSAQEKLPSSPASSAPTAAQLLRSRKLKTHHDTVNKSPFPTFLQPTPEACHEALTILSRLHGPQTRPATPLKAGPKHTAGCGDSPSVLDALVRTILSQNTTDGNSSRAKSSMDAVYGGSDNWAAIVEGGEDKLEAAIRCGGLSKVKAKVILNLLSETYQRAVDGMQSERVLKDDSPIENGTRDKMDDGFKNSLESKQQIYSLDYLHNLPTQEAYTTLLSFPGVGPKTASCVLLFCLRRDSFAVDTHVWRITGHLGWRPRNASREATQAHLEVRVPDQYKYGLHVLMVTHGKRCTVCKAGGAAKGAVQCELRKAFAGGNSRKGASEEVKEIGNGGYDESES